MLHDLFAACWSALAMFHEWRSISYPLFCFAVSFLVPRTACYLLQRSARLGSAAGWVERARVSYPARFVAGAASVYLLIIILIAGSMGDTSVRGRLLVIACALASYAGSNLNLYYIQRWLGLQFDNWRTEVAGRIVYFLFFIGTFLLVNWVIMSASAYFASPLWGSLLGFLSIVLLLQSGANLYLLQIFGLLGQPSERLRRIAAEAASEIALPFSVRVYELRSATANAFAFHRRRAVVVTDSALNLMNDRELKSVLHHEYAHLTESRTDRSLRLAPLFGYFVFLGCWPIYFSSRLSPLWFFPALIIAIWLMRFFSSRISKRLEERADSSAATALPEQECIYATALEKLYEKNLMPAVIGRRLISHPDLYDRMEKAGVSPSYPRPLPPRRLGSILGMTFVVLFGTALVLAPFIFESATKQVRSAASGLQTAYKSTDFRKLRRKFHWPARVDRSARTP